jgi:LmbE family N-acetylglucosaminyl deacetylase
VEIWTFFAGIPKAKALTPFAKSLHDRWNLSDDAPKIRREEDIAACLILGASHKHFDYLDCIYRLDDQGEPIVKKEEDLYQDIPSSQIPLIEEISTVIQSEINQDEILVAPMTIGNHIDHQIIYQSVINSPKNNLMFYQDFPYVIKTENNPNHIQNLNSISFNLSKENIKKWHQSIAAYESQISTFWINIERMESEIKEFYRKGGGKHLWKT